jgi:hypothetical protein
MERAKTKRLELTKETVRALSQNELKAIAGGTGTTDDSNRCGLQ